MDHICQHCNKPLSVEDIELRNKEKEWANNLEIRGEAADKTKQNIINNINNKRCSQCPNYYRKRK
jgi:hypothetical protein